MNIIIGIIVFIIGSCMGEFFSNLLEDDYNTSIYNDSVTIVIGKKSTTVVDTPPTPKEKETEEKTNTEEKTDNNTNKETE